MLKNNKERILLILNITIYFPLLYNDWLNHIPHMVAISIVFIMIFIIYVYHIYYIGIILCSLSLIFTVKWIVEKKINRIWLAISILSVLVYVFYIHNFLRIAAEGMASI